MQIKNMFEKQIDRDIKGVIKVGQSDEENVYQELDEYVVTKELLKHFRDFFNNYEKGIDGYTDKMGVWISGFFGSGKSHFLKILSYLLKNSTVEGKRAIEYFTDGKKIEDPMLIAEMTKAGTIESDVMLFNIDSKGSAKVGSGKEAIVEVFMKVFNEMQGYCGSIPYLAEFERQLDNEGRFEEFKAKFEANAGAPWEKKRQAFAVIQDKVVKTLVEMDFMSEEAARNWCKDAKGSYDLSIEKFVSLVQEYCAKKGPNHHVIFLVDEIGQYIADDTQLMLNLQTIVEDLGTACKGKAWVIVTSQEDIDSITKTKGNDFSKIQGRFDTRLSLSASNVDEVIRKRVLAKNETATQTLRLLYEQKESIIKNLITFTADTADKKLYADKADFADCYPFIPYQFNLLGQVLTAVRTHGASGKHLSDQSRSMLALFQESAIRVMDKEDGVLVPFSFFYDPLHKFIDHQHSQVISDAENNSKLDEFDVELLKVLFMIKYVKEIKANVDNLTTLMISNIDDDRIEVRSKIEESLKKLIKETLVQKNGEIYIFLTNEEQEINNAINNESVEMGEIIGEASIVIFEEIYTEKKYRYSSRYLFPFNQKVDDRFFKGNQSNDIGVTVITPYGGDYADSALRLLSAQESSVIVKLPNDSTFLDEITESIKIYKFLNKNASGARGSFDSIRRAKEDERIEKKDRIRIFIEDALKNADIYVNGDKATISAKEPATRINEALGKLVAMKYNKLTYMETAPELSDISAIFKHSDGQMSFLGTSDTTPNKLALEEVVQVIGLNNARHMKTSLKSLQDKFGAAPYGFDPKDVQWLVRVLSSEKEGKNEPDVVTMAPEIDWDFTDKEREEIIDAKMNNRLDDLFRMLFIKQCNLLHEVLPGLFEETEDYTEMLLNISFTNEADVIRMLVDGIDEKDFNITTVDEDGKAAGQVEIIGWLYQYYNTEPKNKAFAKKAKITKEEIPAVTQLFTPDWIVRYMVENSLGRMWLEGHPDEELKSKWKYYLDEAEQEESVQHELNKIKAEYATLKPEDIKLIDPCMGSGHILVYAFDVFMQIYENAGWSQRDAAQSIIQNNIYGLDIDDRAAQLSYFAVLMKARQYDRTNNLQFTRSSI